MIIATAGHVDHGKTTLVKALTGTDTDRLPEEKNRGLTIDLGFAYLQSGAHRLGFIDVPGHERFVRNAIAGVSLAHVALLVVAADDGPMPQTIEHLAILNLVAVETIIPVITKTDLVDQHRLAELKKQLQVLLLEMQFAAQEYHLEFFEVSNTDSESVEALKNHLGQLANTQNVQPHSGNFRMAVDRSFTLEGSGTIATGTVASGMVRVEDSVNLVSNTPQTGTSVRVRSLHAQNTKAGFAVAGQRCALNLTGDLKRSDLQRGCWLVGEHNFQPTQIFDVMLQLVPSVSLDNFDTGGKKHKPLFHQRVKHWTPAHLHIGTADVACRIALLEVSRLEAGEHGLARLICDKRVACANGDRFILRDQSAQYTIAGGVVLDPCPPRRGRSRPARLLELDALHNIEPGQALGKLLALSDTGIRLDRFSRQFDLPENEMHALCEEHALTVVRAGDEVWGLTAGQCGTLERAILKALQQFHDQYPDQSGVDIAGVEKLIDAAAATVVVEHCLRSLQSSGQLSRVGSVFSMRGHEVVMAAEDSARWQQIEQELLSAELVPPRVAELASLLSETPEETAVLLSRFASHGKLCKVTDNRFFLPQTLRSLAVIAAELGATDTLTVAEFRNRSGVGRNLVVELLEFFDRIRFTQRIGDKRRLLRPVEEKF